MNPKDRIFCAIDTPDLDRALAIASAIKGNVGGLKLGLEFYSALGPDGVRQMSALGFPVFLDLKFHDIPNTVARAIKTVAPLGPKMITIHTFGGLQMMKTAKQASLEAAKENGVEAPLILGVTVLTSLDDQDLHAIGVGAGAGDQVVRLAGLAQKAGLDGVVCSPLEISKIREKFGNDLKLVVPGIRPLGADAGDQKRTMTPGEAIENGADCLVIGRPITAADDPAKAAQAIAESLAGH